MELDETISGRRKRTRSSIYHYLYHYHDFCSKQTVASNMDLSLPTVYQNLDELMQAGLVGYTGKFRTTGGRRAMGLDIIADARISIGISIAAESMYLTAVDLRMKELAFQKVRQPLRKNVTAFCNLIAKKLEEFIEKNQLQPEKILGVGLALPAILSEDGQTVVWTDLPYLKNASLHSLFDSIAYPVHICNSALCGAQAELYAESDGGQNPVKMAACLFLEEQLAGCMIIDSQVYGGNHGAGFQAGRICVENSDDQNAAAGELDRFCSLRRITDTGLSVEKFFRAVEEKGAECCAILDDLLIHLARGIHSLSLCLDCRILLCGTLSRYLAPYISRLQSLLDAQSVYGPGGDVFSLSRISGHCVPLGASLYFIQNFLLSV